MRRGIYEKYSYRERCLLADNDLMLRLHFDGADFRRIDRPLAVFRLGGASSVYYSTRRDVYRLRREHGLMTRGAYVYRRCALPFRAAFRRLKAGVEKAFFPEMRELRVERGRLMADNIAMKEEIGRASAHIDKLEREMADRDAEIEGL